MKQMADNEDSKGKRDAAKVRERNRIIYQSYKQKSKAADLQL